MEGVNKDLVKDQIKKNYIRYVWELYKMTIEDIFDKDGSKFFEFIDEINLSEELPKVATQEYLDILNRYSEFKKEIEEVK
jgi:hypothetical protein